MWTYLFNIKKIFQKIGNWPIMKKVGKLGQFCWQIWVPCQISNMKLLLNCNIAKFWKNIYLATKWSWYLGLYHIYMYIYIYIYMIQSKIPWPVGGHLGKKILVTYLSCLDICRRPYKLNIPSIFWIVSFRISFHMVKLIISIEYQK